MVKALSTARFPFVAEVSAPSRRLLTQLTPRFARSHTPLLKRGDEVEGAYFVMSGALRVFQISPEGREATLYWVEPGETCILALTAAFRRERYPAWVETDHEPASIVVVPGETFRHLFDVEPAFRSFVFEVLSRRVFGLMASLEEVGSLRIEQRVAAFLVRRADGAGVVHVSQARLAAHLGTAREVVSRALRALAARDLLSVERGRVRLREPAALAQLARP